jgi:hypothetical protein
MVLLLFRLVLYENLPNLYDDIGIIFYILDYESQLVLAVIVGGVIGLILGKMNKGYFYISFVSPIIAVAIVSMLVYFSVYR